MHFQCCMGRWSHFGKGIDKAWSGRHSKRHRMVEKSPMVDIVGDRLTVDFGRKAIGMVEFGS